MTTLRAYFTIINNRLAYNVQAENTFRHGKKSHYTHRRVFWTNNLDSKCRNLYTNNYTNQLVVRYPEDIRKGKYFYTRECDNEWSECSQNVFLSAYNYMTVEDEQKILKVSPDFKYTLNKFAISDMCHSYTVLNVWKLFDFILDGDRTELNYYTVIFSSDEEIKAFCEYVKDLNTFCNSKKQFYISFEELEKNKKYIFAENKYFSFITSKEKVLTLIENTFRKIEEE